ncbi:MAG: hypothetical protein ACKOCX_08325 [Planctomycetota bacterium]
MKPPVRRIRCAATAALVAVIAACLPGLAAAQVRLTIELGEVRVDAVAADELVEGNAVAEGNAAAIGDPWWDDAPGSVPEPPAADPPPADGRARARQQAQARLADVRRSRGTQILKRELSLVRAACPTLEPAARARILAAGREAVAGQAAGRTPLVDGVEHALEEALRQQAGSAAADAYRAERDARVARRRATAIAVLVEAIDRDALLDADGRAALREAFAGNWRPEWDAAVTSPLRQRSGDIRLPDGVVEVAAAVLDDDTFTAWRHRAGEAGR